MAVAARHLHGARGVEHPSQSLESGGPLGEVAVGGGALGGFGGVGEGGMEHFGLLGELRLRRGMGEEGVSGWPAGGRSGGRAAAAAGSGRAVLARACLATLFRCWCCRASRCPISA